MIRPARASRCVVLAVIAVMGSLAANDLAAQSAGTLHPLDPAYRDLARLESAGLVPRGWVAQRPYSIARVARMVRDAAAWMAQGGSKRSGATDLEAIMSRLGARFGQDRVERGVIFVDGEAGGGESPGRGYLDNGIGELDAVANPLWAHRAGRAYGDRYTAATSVRLTLPVGARVAFGLAARASKTGYTGIPAGDPGRAIETAYVRAVLGRMAVQVGRDSWSWGLGGRSSLLMSDNGPAIDLVRLSTERPWNVAGLGETDLTVTAADLGPNQNFPGAKLFGAKLSFRPRVGLRIGMAVLDKQMGDGAPDASVSDRLKDLSFAWDLFRRGRDYVFSEKLISLDVRASFPHLSGFEISGETTLTDLGTDRIRDVLQADGAYRLSVGLTRLGPEGRHSVRLLGARIGPRVYRHHQFTSGLAVDGHVQGLEVGPDGRSVTLEYGYSPASEGWDAAVGVSVGDRSVDGFVDVYDPALDFMPDPLSDFPNERRTRIEGRLARFVADGAGGVEVSGGIERVSDFAHTLGADRTNRALLVRAWFSF